MLSEVQKEVRKQARTAIVDELRKAGEPVGGRKLLDSIIEKQGIKDTDLGEAVWYLIGQGEIVMTWDRKLVSKDFAGSYSHRGHLGGFQ